MLISKFSRDGKSGFAVGSNNLTPDKLAAGFITAAAGILIAALGGLIKPVFNRTDLKKSRKKSEKSESPTEKKKKPLWLAALPFVFSQAKKSMKKKGFDGIVSDITSKFAPEPEPEPEPEGIDVVYPEQVSKGDELYDYIADLTEKLNGIRNTANHL